MVHKGASLAEVGDVLRHRSRASTMIYAKLDRVFDSRQLRAEREFTPQCVIAER